MSTVINLGGKPTINVNSNKPGWQAHNCQQAIKSVHRAWVTETGSFQKIHYTISTLGCIIFSNVHQSISAIHMQLFLAFTVLYMNKSVQKCLWCINIWAQERMGKGQLTINTQETKTEKYSVKIMKGYVYIPIRFLHDRRKTCLKRMEFFHKSVNAQLYSSHCIHVYIFI